MSPNERAKANELKLAYDNATSSLFTWWKVFLLSPWWVLAFIPFLGKLFRDLQLDELGLGSIFAFGIYYFWLDLHSKHVRISDDQISLGTKSIEISKIKRVWMAPEATMVCFWRERALKVIQPEEGQFLRVAVDRLAADDVVTLVELIQRRSPKCEINADVDEMIRYKKLKPRSMFYSSSSSVQIGYHANRDWETCPKTLSNHSPTGCAYLVPVGVFPLAAPIWISLTPHCFMSSTTSVIPANTASCIISISVLVR